MMMEELSEHELEVGQSVVHLMIDELDSLVCGGRMGMIQRRSIKKQ